MNSAFLSMSPDERNAYIAREAREYRERKSAAADAADDGPLAPVPLRREMPAGEAFPSDAMGDVLGGAVKAIGDKIQCAPGLAGASVLAAASLAAQALCDVEIPATGQARPLSLFMVSVAASGDRKSSADADAMGPIRQREKMLRTIYEEALPDYRRAKRAFDVAVSNAEKTKGDWREIEAAMRAIGDEPVAPLLPYLTADEPSLEGLHKLFERGQPAMGLFSDEGGGFLGGYSMGAENRLKTLAGLSLFWDGGVVRRIRAGDGATSLVGRRLAMHLMVQPGAASGLLCDAVARDQGFLARVLVSAPLSLAGSRLQKPIASETEGALRRYNSAILDLLESPLPLADGASNCLEPRRLTFDERAAGAWLRLCDAIETKLGAGGEYEPIRGFANKLAEHVARLAGVLTVSENSDAGEINSDALARAVALGDYFAGEGLRLIEAGAATPDVVNAEKALQWLQASGRQTFGLACLYQYGPNAIRDAATARKALDILEAHNWVARLSGKRHKIDGKIVREGWRLTNGGF